MSYFTEKRLVKTTFYSKNTYIFVLISIFINPVLFYYGCFQTDSKITKDNTPPMPLNDAHLGGLFFYSHE